MINIKQMKVVNYKKILKVCVLNAIILNGLKLNSTKSSFSAHEGDGRQEQNRPFKLLKTK